MTNPSSVPYLLDVFLYELLRDSYTLGEEDVCLSQPSGKSRTFECKQG